MTTPECDVRLVVADLAINRERARILIRVWELAALHKLEQMQNMRVLEQ